MTRCNLHRLLVVFTALCAVLLSITAFAAAPPDLINYQGRLLKSDDTPVTDGSHLLRFSLWDDSTGGSELWSETQTVTTTGGLFTTPLGKSTAFPEVCAPCNLWLQTQVQDGGSSSTLSPRQQLMSVPYSLVTSELQGESNPSSPGSPIAKGTIKGGGGMGGGTGREYHIILEADTDGDGIAEHGWDGRASTDSGASTTMSSDPNEDGHPDHLVTMASDATSSSLEVTNIGSSGQDGVSVDVGGTTSNLKVLSLWGLPPGEPVTGTLLIHTDPDHSSITMGDVTGDGRAAMTCYRDSVVEDHSALNSGAYGGKIRGMCSNVRSTALLGVDDVIGTSGIDDDCDLTSASTQLSRRTGSTTGTIRMAASGGGAIIPSSEMSLDMDTDDDGVMESSSSLKSEPDKVTHLLTGHSGSTTGTIRMAATPDSGSTTLGHDNDNDGVSETTNSQACDAIESRSILKGRTGSTTGTIRMAASSSGGAVGVDRDDDNDGVADRSVTMDCDDTDARLDIGSEGQDGISMVSDASGSRMAVDTVPTSKAITVGGGAYCDGTNWVNASDKNAKENFRAVNGRDILQKIETLPISQWNYKQDNDAVKHIGPTAQDFKATFGVGADDKSISTIDPSGIALAAIQQLIKENEELRARIAKLEKAQAK